MSDISQVELLAHIQEGYLDDAAFNQHCVDFSVGPLKIEACIDISVPSASVSVYLAGVRIGGCQLSPQHTNCKIGGSVDGFKAEVAFNLVPPCLDYDATVKTPFKSWHKNGHIWCW